MAKGSGGKDKWVTLGLGVVAGIVIGQIFEKQIDPIYEKIPVVGQFKAGHGYYY